MKTLAPYSNPSFASVLDSFFNDGYTGGRSVSQYVPEADIFETDEAFEIELLAPGFTKEEISIDLTDGTLNILGEHEESAAENDSESRKTRRREITRSSFKRSFKLPRTIKNDAIAASLENGILSITLPKVEKQSLSTTIKIG